MSATYFVLGAIIELTVSSVTFYAQSLPAFCVFVDAMAPLAQAEWITAPLCRGAQRQFAFMLHRLQSLAIFEPHVMTPQGQQRLRARTELALEGQPHE